MKLNPSLKALLKKNNFSQEEYTSKIKLVEDSQKYYLFFYLAQNFNKIHFKNIEKIYSALIETGIEKQFSSRNIKQISNKFVEVSLNLMETPFKNKISKAILFDFINTWVSDNLELSFIENLHDFEINKQFSEFIEKARRNLTDLPSKYKYLKPSEQGLFLAEIIVTTPACLQSDLKIQLDFATCNNGLLLNREKIDFIIMSLVRRFGGAFVSELKPNEDIIKFIVNTIDFISTHTNFARDHLINNFRKNLAHYMNIDVNNSHLDALDGIGEPMVFKMEL